MRLKRYRELLEFFYLQRIKGFDVPSAPMLEPRTAEFLEAKLAEAKLYIEFGSGGSTLLADRMGVRTISVESDRYYAKAVRKRLSGPNVRVLTPNIGVTAPWGYPLFRRPTRRRQRRWRNYIEAPFANGAPDLVLIDGRFRVACSLQAAHHAHEHSHPATLLFEDYASRPQYRIIERYLGVPQMIGRVAVFEIGCRPVPKPIIEDPS
jgi:hypothetical protein